MSHSRDLILARMRQLALRWRAPDPPAPEPTLAWAEESPGVPTAMSDPDERRREEPPQGQPLPVTPRVLEPQPGPPLLVVLALVVVGVVAGAGWMVVRARPAWLTGGESATPAVQMAASASVDLQPWASPSASALASVVVHVTGEVRHPGVVSLPAGSRVADALAAVGGLRRGGRLGATNLARALTDGERIDIGPQAGPADVAGGAAAGPNGAGEALVDLNTATAEQLDGLPGVGPVTAAKILAWRTEHGRFRVVDELAEVPGIGPKTLEELRPHVRI